MSKRRRKSPLKPPRGIVKPRTVKPPGWGGPGEEGGFAIRLTLAGTEPPIWRLLEVPGALSLHLFHLAIQIAMPWENYHLHEFLIGGERWGVIGPAGYRPGMGVREEREATLADVIPGEGFTFQYTYDWGDRWRHDLVVERVIPPGKGLIRPRCVGGSGAVPPEDCGGVDGFYDMQDILQDPRHPDHDRTREWLGGDFDPDLFNTLVSDQFLRSPPDPDELEPASQNPAEFFNYIVHRAVEEEQPDLSRKRDYQRFMDRQRSRFEELPDPDFGGLSPRQLDTLMQTTWDRPGSAVRFVRDLTADDLSGVPAFEQARGLLEAIAARGGCVPLHEGGTFEPDFVADIFSRREWSQMFPEGWEPPAEDESEESPHPVDQLGRMLGERALLLDRRGRRCLTSPGRRLLAPEGAGDLLAEVFMAVFAGPPDGPADSGQLLGRIRSTAAFVLWRFSVLPLQWYDLSKAAVETFPATATRMIASAWERTVEEDPGRTATAHQVADPWSAVLVAVHEFVLRPLSYFGLLEHRDTGKKGTARAPEFRRSPLLERFIRFEGLPTEPCSIIEWLER